MLNRCTQLLPYLGLVILMLLLLLCPPRVYGDQLELDALSILKTRCYGCHGIKHNGDPQFDVTNLSYLQSPAKGYIVAGKPDASKLYRRIAKGEMPPPDAGKAPVTPAELNTLREWISRGAKAAKVTYEERHTVTERWVRDVIRRDATRRQYRYFSLANLYNQGLDDDQLAIARAAFAKALNLLQLTRFIVIPKQIDDKGLVFRVDQGDLDWDNAQFQKLLDEYPYHEAKFYVRADWFIARALVPPLYYTLTAAPDTKNGLEQALGINTDQSFLDGRAIRIGTITSRVANVNRVLQRDPTVDGSYWQSYDFKNQDGKKDIVQNPNGPVFAGNPFVDTAFEHDGGEIIFTMPNGFPGFFVVNAKGARLDKAPEDVVTDNTRISRTAAVVPGLSCITCHTEVIQTKITDAVRAGFPFGGGNLQQVTAVYRNQRDINTVLDLDRKKYVQALDQTLTPYITSRAEPIREVVERYNQPLTLEQAAVEVSVDPYILKKAILSSNELQRKGLRPLTEGRTIPRQSWESNGSGFTPAQTVVKVLALYQE